MEYSREMTLSHFLEMPRTALLLMAWVMSGQCGLAAALAAPVDDSSDLAETTDSAGATTRPNFDDSRTLAAMIPLSTPNVVPVRGDRVQTFTSLSGKTVTIIVQVPHPARDAVYDVPALAAGQGADRYFADAIGYAQTKGYGTVRFPKGTYNFAHTWSEASVTDLTIDLQDSTLNFAHTGFAIVFNGPTRVLLKSFTVDYPRLTFAATGTIIDGANGHKAVRIDEQYPVDEHDPPPILAVEIWDRAENVFAEGNTIDYYAQAGDVQYAGDQVYESKDGFFDNYPDKSPVLVRYNYPGGGGVAVTAGQHVTLENVHVTSSPGFGFFFPGGDGFRLTGCSVTRTNGRPISSVADALNFSSAEGDIILEDGDFSYQGDDGFSDGGNLRQFKGLSDDKATIAGDGTTANVGDVFAFFDANLQFLGESAISADQQSANDATDTLTLATPIPALKNKAAWAIDLFMSGSRVYVVRNRFTFNRARGVYAINPYSLVQDNRFEGNTLASVLVATDASVFFQGAAAVDLQIVNNIFKHTAPDGAIYDTATNAEGVVDSAVLQNIAIEENRFEDLLGPAIQLNSSKDIWIHRNSIRNADLGAYSYSVGEASTKGSIAIADSRTVFGGSNRVSGRYGPISIDPATTDSIGVKLIQAPNPPGTFYKVFGEPCGSDSTCYYSAGGFNAADAMLCSAGSLKIRQATYGTAASGLIESCLAPVQEECDGKSSCTFSFSTRSCGGLNPAPNETSTGTTLVSCE